MWEDWSGVRGRSIQHPTTGGQIDWDKQPTSSNINPLGRGRQSFRSCKGPQRPVGAAFSLYKQSEARSLLAESPGTPIVQRSAPGSGSFHRRGPVGACPPPQTPASERDCRDPPHPAPHFSEAGDSESREGEGEGERRGPGPEPEKEAPGAIPGPQPGRVDTFSAEARKSEVTFPGKVLDLKADEPRGGLGPGPRFTEMETEAPPRGRGKAAGGGPHRREGWAASSPARPRPRSPPPPLAGPHSLTGLRREGSGAPERGARPLPRPLLRRRGRSRRRCRRPRQPGNFRRCPPREARAAAGAEQRRRERGEEPPLPPPSSPEPAPATRMEMGEGEEEREEGAGGRGRGWRK
uniref:Proline-rich protein HaeIII subfamily 1-like n=1 Tax=Phascolarctos cinereus TaxID=38626 RepID=A0A6P5LAX9_PHACI|nr:proline-rich protein HaeIII subfamily 1-like [Phascolarctos cinereus]